MKQGPKKKNVNANLGAWLQRNVRIESKIGQFFLFAFGEINFAFK